MSEEFGTIDVRNLTPEQCVATQADVQRVETKVDALPRFTAISNADRLKGAPTVWTMFGDETPVVACVTCVEVEARQWEPLEARLQRIEEKLDRLLERTER